MMRFLVSVIAIAHVSALSAQTLTAPVPGKVLVADEVNIKQEKGWISKKPKAQPSPDKPLKAAPEGSANVPLGPSNPATCDPKNASSPACYTATQQGTRR